MGADFKFIHCADLHLGARFRRLTAYDPALGRQLAEGTFASFHRIVDLALAEQVDFVVIAGDIFNEGTETPGTRSRFVEELSRLTMPVFMVRGNHDHVIAWDEGLPFPPNVTLMGTELEKYRLDIRGRVVEIVGCSFPELHTGENLALKMHGSPGVFTIGLLHCTVSEVAATTEYAPCARADLLGRNIEYWALGHIHLRTVVQEADPCIVYPGDIQGLSPKEVGEKGAYLVEVTGERCRLDFRPTQELLWTEVQADIAGQDQPGVLAQIKAQARPGSLVSLDLVGRGPLDRMIRADPPAFLQAAERATGCRIGLNRLATGPALDLDQLAAGQTVAGQVVRTGRELEALSGEELLARLCERWPPAKDHLNTLQWMARSGRLQELLTAAEGELLTRLTEGRA